MTRQVAVFDSYKKATEFANAIHSTTRSRGSTFGSFLPRSVFSSTAHHFGGFVQPAIPARSSDLREQFQYDYKPVIHPVDRDYLARKHPTARFIVEKIPTHLWQRLPTVHPTATLSSRDAQEFTEFFAEAERRGGHHRLRTAHAQARVHGGGFVYVNTRGSSAINEPVSRGDRIAGYRFVPLSAVDHDSLVLSSDDDPLVPHGVESLRIHLPTPGEQDEPQALMPTVEVHGSRLISLAENAEPHVVQTEPIIDVVHDDLWNWSDIIVAQRNAQIQGAPFAVEVKTEEGYSSHVHPDVPADEDPFVIFEEEMEEFRGFSRDHFTGIEGATITRLPAAELNVPEDVIRSLVGRVASVVGVPASKLFPSSRGSEQTSPEEQADFHTALNQMRDYHVAPALHHLVAIGKAAGQVRRLPSLPAHFDWPDIQYTDARTRAFVRLSDARALKGLAEVQRSPPPELDTRYPFDDSIPPPQRAEPPTPQQGRGRGRPEENIQHPAITQSDIEEALRATLDEREAFE